MTTKEHLQKAVALLRRDGWCKGVGRFGDRRCALVALIDTTDGSSGDAIRALQRINDSPITLWNDAPERTMEDVLAAFDRAIASCD